MGNPLILVVEDEVNIQKLLCLILTKNGFTVIAAENGEEALKILQSGVSPDLILLDLIMPKIDGITVLRTIRQDPKLRPLKVVLLSALAGNKNQTPGIETLADDFIVKPFKPNDLLERVRNLLAKSRAA